METKSTPLLVRAGAALALALFLGAGAYLFWIAISPRPEAVVQEEAGTPESPAPSSVLSAPPLPTGLPASAPALAAEDQARVALLDEFFRTKNDNDPRMDTELRHLSPALKEALIAKYAALPAEARNERGTIVFLIGRDLATASDVTFLHSVLSETPCVGLASCGTVDRGSDHDQLASDITLAYPQLVALKAFAKQRKNKGLSAELRRQIEDSLAAAKGNANPLISRAAEEAAGDLEE